MRTKLKQLITLTPLILALSGCWFPGVFRIDVAQGNIITQQLLNQLKPGMTKEQVLYLLGTPMVQDSFNKNRWDYIYNFSQAGKPAATHQVTLFFEGEQFTHFTGTPPKDPNIF